MHETLPEDWGADELSEYLDTSISNCVATFANSKAEYSALQRIDSIFVRAGKSIDHTNEVWPAILFFRSHSSFRTAVYLSMAGHQIETFAILRQAIEYALYANHMSKNPESIEAWLARSNSEKERARCRTEFSYANVIKSVKLKHLNQALRSLYVRCIDYGAHPNEASVFTSMLVERDGKGTAKVKQTILSCENQLVGLSQKTIRQAGICMLDVFRSIWSERFQIMGLAEELREQKKGL